MTTKYNQQSDFNYYIENQEKLVKKYDGRYVIISNKKIIGSSETAEKAIDFATKKLKNDNFIVQLVGSGKDNYTKIISRVKLYAGQS